MNPHNHLMMVEKKEEEGVVIAKEETQYQNEQILFG
jgi:hypothetical protein